MGKRMVMMELGDACERSGAGGVRTGVGVAAWRITYERMLGSMSNMAARVEGIDWRPGRMRLN